MDTDAWLTYTTFFTHVQQTCFYFKQELWHDETTGLLQNLQTTSSEVLTNLSVNLAQTAELRDQQRETYQVAREAASLSEDTNRALIAQKDLQLALSHGLQALS